jgi:hypothetical protein
LPDAKWMRKEIAIADVAHKLGLQGDGRRFDCCRKHPPGKGRRSLGLHPPSNTMRCFSCDRRSLSTIDLVMEVKGWNVGAAMRWLDENFSGIPRVEIHSNGRMHRQNHARPFTLQNLFTSPGWMALSPKAKVVLTAVFARAPVAGSEQASLRCTYEHIIKWTGIRSRTTIAATLKELRAARAAQIATVQTNFRTKRGFWLRELFIRVSPHAMRARPVRATTPSNTTGTSVQNLDSQYAVQNLDSRQEVEIEA